MKTITLKSKLKINYQLDLRNLSRIDNQSNIKTVQNIKILFNNREKKLHELFKIEIKDNKSSEFELTLEGLNKNCNFVGWKWKNGILKVKSNIGIFLGAKMLAGKIIVYGSVENNCAAGMLDGTIIIQSDAKNFVCSNLPGERSGMSGGVVIIKGNVENYLGSRMKKGLIFVGGRVGKFCANNMIAGTIVAKKGVGSCIGLGMKRGTIITKKNIAIPFGFVESGGVAVNYLNTLNKFFEKNFRIRILSKKLSLKKYIGDRKENGLGEIFLIN